MDLISIIVPVYNVEAYLKRCIESILNQTYKDIEIILVDDGSTDNSSKICDEYKNKDKRIKVIHKVNGGLSSARNRGLDIAKGKYIGFVDSDDYISPKMYEILYKELINNNADISACDDVVFQKKEAVFNIVDDYKIEIYNKYDAMKELISLTNHVDSTAWNKLYKKSLFNKVRYPNGFIYEDIGTTFKLINKIKKIVYVDLKLYAYNFRVSSITNTNNINKKTIYDKFEMVELRGKFIASKYPNLENDVKNNYVKHFIYTLLNTSKMKDKSFLKEDYFKNRYKYFKKIKLKELDKEYLNKKTIILFILLKINMKCTIYLWYLLYRIKYFIKFRNK